MKRVDLKAFRKANKLTQTQLGEYLGINKSFISTIESGKDPMPEERLTKLLENPCGWDTSMLVIEEPQPTSKPAPKIKFVVGAEAEDAKEREGYIKRLLEEIKELKAQRDALMQEVAVLKYQLEQK